jgi:FkbM family methyltransferase
MRKFEKLGFKQYLIDTKEIPNDGYVMNYGDRDIVDDNLLYCWEANTIIRINENEEGYFDFSKSMIDVGSFVGTHSFATDFNHYHMFDGNREFCVISQFNMLLHDKLDRCDIYNVLLSDKVGEIGYDGFNTEYTDMSNNNVFRRAEAHKTKCVTLDSFSLENIGFIKVDVEGMEYNVLNGGLGTIIRNNYPPILFELWKVGYYGMTQEKHDLLVNFLEDLGYEIKWEWGDWETHLAVHK